MGRSSTGARRVDRALEWAPPPGVCSTTHFDGRCRNPPPLLPACPPASPRALPPATCQLANYCTLVLTLSGHKATRPQGSRAWHSRAGEPREKGRGPWGPGLGMRAYPPSRALETNPQHSDDHVPPPCSPALHWRLFPLVSLFLPAHETPSLVLLTQKPIRPLQSTTPLIRRLI